MNSTNQQAKAVSFRRLHEDGVLVLPNAWDAGSAAVIAAAGAKAIATTSGGVSWAQGRSDGQRLTRDEMVALVGRIAETVDLPVTADVEGGYGPDPDDVVTTVRAAIGAGVVGINLEDSRPDYSLFDPAAQVARIQAARQAAAEAGLPELFVNIRTDVFLFGIGAPEGRLDDVLARAEAYAAAGADGMFVPGLLDLDTIETITSKVSKPVNVMAGEGAPNVEALARAGVRRVSLGTAVAQAAYTVARKVAVEALTMGTYDTLAGADGFGDINGAFSSR